MFFVYLDCVLCTEERPYGIVAPLSPYTVGNKVSAKAFSVRTHSFWTQSVAAGMDEEY